MLRLELVPRAASGVGICELGEVRVLVPILGVWSRELNVRNME